MQSTGQASTQAVSLVPMQGSAITYAIAIVFQVQYISQRNPETQIRSCQWRRKPGDPVSSRIVRRYREWNGGTVLRIGPQRFRASILFTVATDHPKGGVVTGGNPVSNSAPGIGSS